MSNKIDSYIMNEQNQQMSQDKLDEMAEQNLGRSKMSDSLHRLAQIKGFNVKKCQVCDNQVMVKDNRAVVVLCHDHMGLTSIVSNMLSKRKRTNLTQDDINSLAKSRNVRTGPFWPNVEATKK